MDGYAPVSRRMDDLSVEECLRLLARGTLGRLGFVVGDRPEVVPVNYCFADGTVVFRTGYGTLLDSVHGRPVVFEIDGIDADYHTGWSVVVHGKAEEVWRPEELERARALPVRPWAPGEREHIVRLSPSAITGRRIHVGVSVGLGQVR